MATPAAAPRQLTLEEAKAAVREAVEVFNNPTNAAQLNDLRTAAGPDIFKLMTTVTPVAITMASGIVSKYGFEPNQPGVMQFIFAIQAHNSDPGMYCVFLRGKQNIQAKSILYVSFGGRLVDFRSSPLCIAQLRAQFLPPNIQMPPMFAQPPPTN